MCYQPRRGGDALRHNSGEQNFIVLPATRTKLRKNGRTKLGKTLGRNFIVQPALGCRGNTGAQLGRKKRYHTQSYENKTLKKWENKTEENTNFIVLPAIVGGGEKIPECAESSPIPAFPSLTRSTALPTRDASSLPLSPQLPSRPRCPQRRFPSQNTTKLFVKIPSFIVNY